MSETNPAALLVALSKKTKNQNQEKAVIPRLKTPCSKVSLWIWVCWKVWRAQKAKRGMQMSKQAPEKTPETPKTLPGVCAVREQGRDAELWVGTRGQGYTSPPLTLRLLCWWPRRQRAGHRPFPKVPTKCQSWESSAPRSSRASF